MGEIHQNQQAHVVAFAFPFGSHPQQVLNVVCKAASSAPDVTFSFFSTANSLNTIFSSKIEPGNIKAYEVDNGLPENYVFSGNHVEVIGLFIKSACENFRKGVQVAESETNKKVSCVVSDAFLWFAGEIADDLGVPWVPVWAPGAASLSMHVHTDRIREKFGVDPHGQEDEALDFIPGMSAVRVGDMPDEVLGADADTIFGKMLHYTGQVLPRASAVAINTLDALENPIIADFRSKLKLCLPIGPLTVISTSLPNDPYGCLPWLDGRKPASVAYVSFGTLATPPPDELAALAEGLEASKTPFLWSLKDPLRAHLPEGFLDKTSERGKVVPWTPQINVLEHAAIGVMIIHCGWNSVMEGIMCGIPIIYRPFFGDHKLVGRFVSDVWKIGIKVHNGIFTKDGTMEDLEFILANEEGKKIKENAEILQKHGREALEPTGSTKKNLNTLLGIMTSG